MSSNSQLGVIYDNATPAMIRELLNAMFDKFWGQTVYNAKRCWNHQPLHIRATVLCDFIARDGEIGEVTRDIYTQLDDLEGAESWVEAILADI